MDINNIKHIAKLSNLELKDDELEHFAHELTTILDHVSELNRVDTAGVEPTAQAVETNNVFRADDEALEENQELAAKLIKAAPDNEDGYVKVKAIL